MPSPVQLTLAEATAIARHVLESRGISFELMSPMQQMETAGGTMAIVQALQELGYRVTRPLTVAPD